VVGELLGDTADAAPPARRHIIRRPRLTRILDGSTARALALVAPAGYGKTTLARQWLEDRRHVWYQGGPATADVAGLAVGLVDVCATVLPGVGERMRARLRVSNSPEQDVQPLAELLAEDLADWPTDTWLAIDDYQYAIGSPAAESFVELLFTGTAVPLLLTSRERPAWVTARRLLYGEVHELSRATLAMDQEEVEQVLSSAGHSQALGLLALADGWPAVIGLAAFSQTPPPKTVPDELFDFFAEEMLTALPPQAEADLSRLAIAPWVNQDVAELLLSEDADLTLLRGIQAGILSEQDQGRLVMHPLLRTFLQGRLSTHASQRSEGVHRLVRFYSDRGYWDEAFAVSQADPDQALTANVLEGALPVLLSSGRLNTLSSWIKKIQCDLPRPAIVELAAAELAYREGAATRARATAERTGLTLSAGDRHKGRFLLLAGKAALLLHDTQAAVKHLIGALDEPLTDDEIYEAVWGRFLAAARLEADDADQLLKELGSVTDGVPDRELRAMNGTWVLGVRTGSIEGLVDQFEGAMPLVEQATDPTIRSAFLISRIHLLTLTARYGEALDAVGELEGEVRKYRLDFALPHISMAHAHAHLGMRQFSQAARLIGLAESAGAKRRDTFVRMNAATLRARLLLYQGRATEAVAHLREHWDVLPEKSLHAEYLSIRALALACTGDVNAAAVESNAITGMTRGIEAKVLNLTVRALIAAQTSAPTVDNDAGAALQAALQTGNYDSLLFACRVAPSFAEAIARQGDCQTHLSGIVRTAGDRILAHRLGLPLPPRVSTSCLTPRESEVYELLALGQTNKEISAALYISEPTARRHTLRVLEKLELRSRTEVALHAREVEP
jgi:ATP/maltotriose-dependent transcriptional regulator MalT